MQKLSNGVVEGGREGRRDEGGKGRGGGKGGREEVRD